MCQSASTDGTFSKQSLATYIFLILNFFLHFSPQEFAILFKYMIEKYFGNKLQQYQNAKKLMLLVEMWNSKKKALSRVAGQPAGEIRVLPAPTQEKEEDLTNSVQWRCQLTWIWPAPEGGILKYFYHCVAFGIFGQRPSNLWSNFFCLQL